MHVLEFAKVAGHRNLVHGDIRHHAIDQEVQTRLVELGDQLAKASDQDDVLVFDRHGDRPKEQDSDGNGGQRNGHAQSNIQQVGVHRFDPLSFTYSVLDSASTSV